MARRPPKGVRDDFSPSEGFGFNSLRARFAAHDFFVDFLGGLVPGLLFLIGITAALGPPLFALIDAFSPNLEKISLSRLFYATLDATKDTPNFLWIAALLAAVGAAYVIGHLFYRQGPKRPNRQSFKKIRKAEEKKWKRRCQAEGEDFDEAAFKEHLRAEYGCADDAECEFPFPYLNRYLEQRGLHHLLSFVSWKDKLNYRSKTYINLLKIRLRFHHPEKVSVIIRNEAHVRLASSTWYVTRAIRYGCALAAGLLILAVFGYARISDGPTAFLGHLSAVIAPLTVLAFAEYGRLKIERFVHYQRLREVFYVLETAFTAFREERHLLVPPFPEEDLGA